MFSFFVSSSFFVFGDRDRFKHRSVSVPAEQWSRAVTLEFSPRNTKVSSSSSSSRPSSPSGRPSKSSKVDKASLSAVAAAAATASQTQTRIPARRAASTAASSVAGNRASADIPGAKAEGAAPEGNAAGVASFPGVGDDHPGVAGGVEGKTGLRR